MKSFRFFPITTIQSNEWINRGGGENKWLQSFVKYTKETKFIFKL